MMIRVLKVCQASNGGSHVTRYEADIEFAVGDVRVEVLDTDPPNADRCAIDAARTAIQRGAARVLEPHGIGALIRVRRLCIHPIDFKPWRYERHTAEELERLLSVGDDMSV